MNYLISHLDLDGLSVNVLNALYTDLLGFDKVFNKNYGFENDAEILQLITPDNNIVITDLSIPEKYYLEWKSKLNSLTIIDHHDSSEYLSKYEGNIWSTSLSGTALFWYKYLKPRLNTFNPMVEYFVNLVDCYDRWQEDSDLWLNATRLNNVCIMMGRGYINHAVDKLTNEHVWEWTELEKGFFIKVEESENIILKQCEEDMGIREDTRGLSFVILEINDKSKLSMVCSKLLKAHSEIDYCVCYGINRRSLSLRTRKDINLTELHGVEGHAKAAGGRYDSASFYALLSGEKTLAWCEKRQRKLFKILVI